MHQVAELPHERLVAIDDRLGLVAVVIEPGSRHGGLDISHGLLALGDARLEVGNRLLPPFRRLIALFLLRRGPLARFMVGGSAGCLFGATEVAPYRGCRTFRTRLRAAPPVASAWQA